jgi:hypothetical protein
LAIADESRHDGASTTVISVSSEETAYPAIGDVSTITNEAASPTITATETDTEDFRELAYEELGADEEKQEMDLETPRYLFHSSSAHALTNRDTGDACDIAFYSTGRLRSEYGDLYVESILSWIDCLGQRDETRKRRTIEEICDYTCIFENLAGKPRMDEWGWDSG